jgi:hypothetical protein
VDDSICHTAGFIRVVSCNFGGHRKDNFWNKRLQEYLRNMPFEVIVVQEHVPTILPDEYWRKTFIEDLYLGVGVRHTTGTVGTLESGKMTFQGRATPWQVVEVVPFNPEPGLMTLKILNTHIHCSYAGMQDTEWSRTSMIFDALANLCKKYDVDMGQSHNSPMCVLT